MGAIGGIGFVVALIFMVMFHEFGHFVTAKRYGMKVTEFFFGFGPRLWSYRPRREVSSAEGGTRAASEEGGEGSVAVDIDTKRTWFASETEYGIKAIPAGGYVKIVGMNPLEDIPPEEEARTFRGKPARQKLVVLVAGSTTHFITAIVLLMTVFCIFGRDGEAIPVIAQVPVAAGPPSPAQLAGFRPGDRVVEIDGQSITSWEEVSKAISESPGQTLTFVVDRGGERVTLRPTIGQRGPEDGGGGFLGVVADSERLRDNPIAGARRSAQAFWQFGFGGLKGLVSFFSPGNLADYYGLLTGDADTKPIEEQTRFLSPVGAVGLGSQAPELRELLFLIAGVNIFVGVFNLLPLFPLDGGWIAVVLYEKAASALRRRKVTVDYRRLVPITYGVLFVLGFIFVTSLYLDITSPIDLNL